MGLLKTILFILLFYYAFKVLSRLFAPLMLKYLSKKAEQRFGGQFQDFHKQRQQAKKKEGEISIDKMPNKKESNTTVGEYVDYEEVD